MKKPLIILLIIFAIRVLVSCCDCLDSTYLKYTFDSIETVHIDNSGQNPKYINSGTILKEAYGIQIKLSLNQLAFFKPLNFGAFNSTFAFDCECPPEIQYLAQDTISEIKIITLNDFDNNHLANSEISVYFKVYTYSNYITIQEFIDTPENIYYEKPDKKFIDIYLMQAPEITGEHQFKVEIGLSNGSILSSTTSLITLE